MFARIIRALIVKEKRSKITGVGDESRERLQKVLVAEILENWTAGYRQHQRRMSKLPLVCQQLPQVLDRVRLKAYVLALQHIVQQS